MVFQNQYEQQRITKAQELRTLGHNPYANDFMRDTDASGFKSEFGHLIEAQERSDSSALRKISGRIKFLRLMGKAAFAKIEDESGILQIYYSRNDLGDEKFKLIKKMFEVGDIIGCIGSPFVTRTGELTMHISEMILLTKAITPLPEKFHGLSDIETRYRQRYLDMIMDSTVRERFRLRSKVVSAIRHFFEEKGFLEVETPMMHPIPGGANARPFVTHHNALDVDRYLRIAPELYLKRLIVGGFEAVFEINRNFRNEGMDHSHNPEFTMIEFYWAYKRYDDLMQLTEALFENLFATLQLPRVLEYDNHSIDFGFPFAKIRYSDALTDIGGVPKEVVHDGAKALQYLKERHIEVRDNMNLGELQAELFDSFVEEKLINPTFITHFPIEISPLARRSDSDENVAERFELFIAGKEIANGFSELNDPLDQYARFKSQVDAKERGDEEACEMDEDYIKALGYGMPPTSGEGIGIDRLVMLLTNSHSIKDVILFPAMKPKTCDTSKEQE